jgi:hypothetical protein
MKGMALGPRSFIINFPGEVNLSFRQFLGVAMRPRSRKNLKIKGPKILALQSTVKVKVQTAPSSDE